MKKAIIILTAFIILFQLVSCGGNNETTPSELHSSHDMTTQTTSAAAEVPLSGQTTVSSLINNQSISSTAHTSSETFTSTETQTTAAIRKIVYKTRKGAIGIYIEVCPFKSGHPQFDDYYELEELENEPDEDTLFYVAIDAEMADMTEYLTDIKPEDYDSISDYSLARYTAKKNILLEAFEKIGLSAEPKVFNSSITQYFEAYITKADYENMQELPYALYLFLLPKDFDWNKRYGINNEK